MKLIFKTTGWFTVPPNNSRYHLRRIQTSGGGRSYVRAIPMCYFQFGCISSTHCWLNLTP